MDSLLHFMQTLDRRWIYLVLAITLVVALALGKQTDPIVLPPVQQLYDAVQAAPAGPGQGKIILVGTTFAAGTIGENGNQARAIFRHLMLSHKRFAIIAVSEPQGAALGKAIVGELAKQYGYKYGTDWIDFDYQIGTLAFFKSFPKDIQGTVKVDGMEKKPLAKFPIMHGINTVEDIALHIEITASASVFDWIQIVQPMTNPRLKIGYAPTGVMATEAYPLLDSRQLVGMVPGLKGAADYERLVDEQEQREAASGQLGHPPFDPKQMVTIAGLAAPARTLMFTQNAAHIVIILFILLGNIGMLLARLVGRSSTKEAA